MKNLSPCAKRARSILSHIFPYHLPILSCSNLQQAWSQASIAAYLTVGSMVPSRHTALDGTNRAQPDSDPGDCQAREGPLTPESPEVRFVAMHYGLERRFEPESIRYIS